MATPRIGWVGARHLSWRRLPAFWLGLAVIAVVAVAACGSPALLERLPRQAGGVTFAQHNIIDESFLSGHAVDDVYAALGLLRPDGTAAFRLDPALGDEIGAVTVRGVSGDRLLEAFVDHWSEAAIIDRTMADIGGRSVWVLEHRGGDRTIAYRRGDIVFYTYSESRERAARYIGEMP